MIWEFWGAWGFGMEGGRKGGFWDLARESVWKREMINDLRVVWGIRGGSLFVGIVEISCL